MKKFIVLDFPHDTDPTLVKSVEVLYNNAAKAAVKKLTKTSTMLEAQEAFHNAGIKSAVYERPKRRPRN